MRKAQIREIQQKERISMQAIIGSTRLLRDDLSATRSAHFPRAFLSFPVAVVNRVERAAPKSVGRIEDPAIPRYRVQRNNGGILLPNLGYRGKRKPHTSHVARRAWILFKRIDRSRARAAVTDVACYLRS